MGIKNFRILFALCFLFQTGRTLAQNYEPIGQHFLYNISTKQYKSNPQNFDVLQGNNNLMYFANVGGVLEYDGENWRTIKIPTQQTFSLAKNKEGKIYIGALDNFGYLKSNENGELVYESLSKSIKKEKVPTIMNILCKDGWVYFFPDKNLANNYLFAYSEAENKSYKVVAPYKFTFERKCQNKIIVQMDNNQIYTIEGKEFKLLSDHKAWENLTIRQTLEINQAVLVYDGEKLYSVPRNWSEPKPYEEISLMPNLNDLIFFRNKIIITTPP